MTQKTLPQLIQQAAQRYGNKLAIKDADTAISYEELNQLRWQAAKAFYAADIKKGDRVAIWAPNVAEWIVATLGLQSVGAILVPLNTRMKGSEAADIINRSGARLLFTVAEFYASPSTVIRYPELLANESLPNLEDRKS